MNESEENKPWYKQPLVWMVIAPPFAAVVAGIITINLAIESDDGLVVDDYYKEGLAINQTIQRDRVAWSMGLKAEMMIENNQLAVEMSGANISKDMSLTFVHPTQGNRDVRLALDKVSDGKYQAAMPADLSGSWNILLEPADKEWRITGRVKLPADAKMVLLPQYSPTN